MPHPTAGSRVAEPAWQRPLQLGGLLAFVGFAALLGVDVVWATDIFSHGWHLVGLALLGYLAADLISGIVHFLADNFGSEETPFFGTAFIRPFREHHTDPLGITRHDFISANGNNALVSLPLLIGTVLLVPVRSSSGGHLVGAFVLFLLIAVFLTNQFHKWAHMVEPPRFAQRLQSIGLILSREHHAVHHTTPHNSHYCITIGLWDSLLERFDLFNRAERVARRWLPGTDPVTRVERERMAR